MGTCALPLARSLAQRRIGERAAAGREEVLVGRVRRDATVEHGLLLWFAADVLRLAAANAVSLAVARLRLHH